MSGSIISHEDKDYLKQCSNLSIQQVEEILRDNFDYDRFNSDEIKYYDDYKDFVTNEPTIAGNATALFVFGYLSSPE